MAAPPHRTHTRNGGRGAGLPRAAGVAWGRREGAGGSRGRAAFPREARWGGGAGGGGRARRGPRVAPEGKGGAAAAGGAEAALAVIRVGECNVFLRVSAVF